MQLKTYQAETLDVLRRFLEAATLASPQEAFAAITGEAAQAQRLGRARGRYRPLEGMPQVPYVCLRLPTGGGKTVLGAHVVHVAREHTGRDRPLVLWLVPSTTIRKQTVEALRNRRHPYRLALDERFDGQVRVFDIGDFTMIRPQDLAQNCVVVVGTIQTLRVTNTEGRKVYAHNEFMEGHFTGRKLGLPTLERLENGKVKYSFANLLHLERPILIVDEAHNAVTGLSREMQRRIRPSVLIELTATPRDRSNILHSVTAQELKNEEMVKLPIVLAEHPTWQSAVTAAILKRAELAAIAATDKDHIRPVVLFQAQPKDQEVTVEALKRHLVANEGVDAAKIAIATGEQRELDDVDLFDPACPIELVITIEALKEGWDCSFAYVFCSVARIQSAVAVEQLLGRVLRMPYARRRAAPALNRAYAFLSEPSFGEAARGLVDKLVAMGFEEEEARENIEAAPGLFDEIGEAPGRPAEQRPIFRHGLTASGELRAVLTTAGGLGLAVEEADNGQVTLVSGGAITPATEAAIMAALPDAERTRFRTAVHAFRLAHCERWSPAELGVPLVVPRLMVGVQGELELADIDRLMEHNEWSLLDHSFRLDEREFTISDTAHGFAIDIDGNRVTLEALGEDAQLALDVEVEGWSAEGLALWLDRQVRQPDLHPSELLRWLRDLVGHLERERRLPIAALMRCKFILARKVRDRLDAIRRLERERTYRQCLFAPEAHVDISFDEGFVFRDGMYDGQRVYRGRYRFTRHFLGADRVPAFDGEDGGEEAQCALALDSLPGVKHWVRNVARHPASFWLPLASGRFYPDFIAELEDGRLFVVEYKGEHIADGADTREKRTIGRLWQDRSGGRGVFAMVEKVVRGEDMRAQLAGAIAGS